MYNKKFHKNLENRKALIKTEENKQLNLSYKLPYRKILIYGFYNLVININFLLNVVCKERIIISRLYSIRLKTNATGDIKIISGDYGYSPNYIIINNITSDFENPVYLSNSEHNFLLIWHKNLYILMKCLKDVLN